MKRFANAALVYGALALAGGVFYREFTRLSGTAGLGHLALGAAALYLLVHVRRSV